MVLPEQAPPCSHSTLVISYVFLYCLPYVTQGIIIVEFHVFIAMSYDKPLCVYAHLYAIHFDITIHSSLLFEERL